MNMFIDGVPYDGVPIEIIIAEHISVTVIFYLLAISGIIFSVTCGGLHIYFRKKK